MMAILRNIYNVTLRDKACSCKMHKNLNVKQPLQMERYQLGWFGLVIRIHQE